MMISFFTNRSKIGKGCMCRMASSTVGSDGDDDADDDDDVDS
jgi:hypothetical protein